MKNYNTRTQRMIITPLDFPLNICKSLYSYCGSFPFCPKCNAKKLMVFALYEKDTTFMTIIY